MLLLSSEHSDLKHKMADKFASWLFLPSQVSGVDLYLLKLGTQTEVIQTGKNKWIRQVHPSNATTIVVFLTDNDTYRSYRFL